MENSSKNTPLYPSSKGFYPENAVPVGGVILAEQDIEYNQCRERATITIRNTGDRPIQVGSHFHLFEVNRYLEFDRKAAFGFHLDIPSTTAIRFEPGDSRQVDIVAYGGKRRVVGFNNLVDGFTGVEPSPAYYPAFNRAMRRVHKAGFGCVCDKKGGDEAPQAAESMNNKDKKDGNNIKTTKQ